MPGFLSRRLAGCHAPGPSAQHSVFCVVVHILAGLTAKDLMVHLSKYASVFLIIAFPHRCQRY